MTARALAHRLRTDEGYLGGVEVMPFGILIFVVGILLLANAWGVIDAKQAATGAAREATRAYVEAPDVDAARAAATRAAEQTMASYGRQAFEVEAEESSDGFVRCAAVTYEVVTTVPILELPLISRAASEVTVAGRHREIVDPLRSGLEGTAHCVEADL